MESLRLGLFAVGLSDLSKAYDCWRSSVRLLLPLLDPISIFHHTSFAQISSSVCLYLLLTQSLLTMKSLEFCVGTTSQGSADSIL